MSVWVWWRHINSSWSGLTSYRKNEKLRLGPWSSHFENFNLTVSRLATMTSWDKLECMSQLLSIMHLIMYWRPVRQQPDIHIIEFFAEFRSLPNWIYTTYSWLYCHEWHRNRLDKRWNGIVRDRLLRSHQDALAPTIYRLQRERAHAQVIGAQYIHVGELRVQRRQGAPVGSVMNLDNEFRL